MLVKPNDSLNLVRCRPPKTDTTESKVYNSLRVIANVSVTKYSPVSLRKLYTIRFLP